MTKAFIAELDISRFYDEIAESQHTAKAPFFPYMPLLRQPPPVETRKTSPVTHQALIQFVGTIILSPDDDLLVDLAQKIEAAAPNIEKSTFPSLWLPFLHNLIPFMEAPSISLSKPRCQQIFTAILKAYITNYVGGKPGIDSSLARQPVPCYCSDCGSLNLFLQDPARSVGRFPLNKARGGHLHSNLDYGEVDCTHLTERRGSPHTLVVTKTFKQNGVARKEWADRNREACAWLKSVGEGKLALLLGEDYERITVGPLTSTSSPLCLQSAAGMKRKAETDVVDLTG